MSGVDVRDLASEKLPPGKFPVDPRADFRLFIAPEVRRGIEQHAKADVTVEICGVLVGNWSADENGPYAAVTDYIRCANAASKFAEVTFTHESWAQINKEMDSKFADSRIVGWYHSHPDFGIFLSERDAFIQEHFFSGPGQVAYVIDPVRDMEGVFAWRDGKPKPMPHFWIGNTVRTVDASERSAGGGMTANKKPSGANATHHEQQPSSDGSWLGLATTVLGGLIAFSLGYIYGGWQAHAKEDVMRQEAVARFADTNLIRAGLDDEMASVRDRLNEISAAMKKLPQPGEKVSKEELVEASTRLKAIQHQLTSSEQDLSRIALLSDAERSVYSRIIELKMSELYQMIAMANAVQQKQNSEKRPTQESAAASGTSTNPPKEKPPEQKGDKLPVQLPPPAEQKSQSKK